ncbi:hypothetical protein ACLMJK_008542 [Lecanora helva]
MARAHYIVRVGNEGLARTITPRTPNHWHYLSPQYLWGFPRDMTHVKVRAKFEADIDNPRITTFIWFLCNGHGGPGHFVQVGIGRRHPGHGPIGNGALPIPPNMMARLQEGFDHWFEWRPISTDVGFQERIQQLPIPQPPYIPTLRRVTGDHPSFDLFEELINAQEQGQAAVAAVNLPAAQPLASTSSRHPEITLEVIEADCKNLRVELRDPHAQGCVYLIKMENTTFYRIGMSLDPDFRLRSLQTGNPHPLSLLNAQFVQDMRSAESRLHRKFEEYCVSNPNVREWFDFQHGPDEAMNAVMASDRENEDVMHE